MNKIFNIGIAGCGAIMQRRHAPEYDKNKDSKIYAITDPNTERMNELCHMYGCEPCESFEKMLDNESIDAVSICTPNFTHVDYSVNALRKNKHVLCEKPLASNIKDLEKLDGLKADKIFMMAYNQRTMRCHLKTKEILDSNRLGKVISFESTFKHSGPDNWSVDNGTNTWFMNKSQAGIGVVGDLGIHKIDLMYYLLSDKIAELYADISTLCKKYPDGSLIDLDDNAMIMCTTASGIKGIITVSWCNNGLEDNKTVIYCEKGKITADAVLETVTVDFSDGMSEKYLLHDKDNNSGVIDVFIQSLKEGKCLGASLDDGIYAMKVVDACIRSSKANKTVTIN